MINLRVQVLLSCRTRSDIQFHYALGIILDSAKDSLRASLFFNKYGGTVGINLLVSAGVVGLKIKATYVAANLIGGLLFGSRKRNCDHINCRSPMQESIRVGTNKDRL